MDSQDARKVAIVKFILNEEQEWAIDRFEEVCKEVNYHKQSKTKVIGYKADGGPIIKSRFVRRIRETITNVNNGEFIELKELERISESW